MLSHVIMNATIFRLCRKEAFIETNVSILFPEVYISYNLFAYKINLSEGMVRLCALTNSNQFKEVKYGVI